MGNLLRKCCLPDVCIVLSFSHVNTLCSTAGSEYTLKTVVVFLFVCGALVFLRFEFLISMFELW